MEGRAVTGRRGLLLRLYLLLCMLNSVFAGLVAPPGHLWRAYLYALPGFLALTALWWVLDDRAGRK